MNPAASSPAAAARTPPAHKQRAGWRNVGLGRATPGDEVIWAAGDRKHLELSLTYVGVMLFMTVIITYRFPIGDFAVGMALVGMLVDRRGVVFPRFLLLLVAFLGWCWLGSLTTRYPNPSAAATLQLAKTALIWWAALASIRTRAQFRWAMIALVFLYATHPIRGAIMNIVVYQQNVFGRTVWNFIFANPNDFAGFTILYLSIAAGLLVTERQGLIRWGAMASCVVFPIVILYTQSRANFLALGFFTLAALAGQKKKARSVGMLVLVLLAALITVPSDAWDRLSGVTAIAGGQEAASQLDSSANERLEIWRVARRVASENLVGGTGWGTFEFAHHFMVIENLAEFQFFVGQQTFKDAHSTYLTVLAETGVPGTVLWVLSIAAVVAFAEKRRRKYKGIAPQAALQLLLLEYGLAAYGISAIWGSYAHHAFLYLHLTWIWVAANLLEKDALKARQLLRTAAPQAPRMHRPEPHGTATAYRRHPAPSGARFDPSLSGFPAKPEAPSKK